MICYSLAINMSILFTVHQQTTSHKPTHSCVYQQNANNETLPYNELHAELHDALKDDTWKSQELVWKFMASQISKEHRVTGRVHHHRSKRM